MKEYTSVLYCYYKEIAKETIEEHINNSEILWDESFVDQYGAENIAQLKLQNEQFLLQHMNSFDGNMLLAVSEKSFTTTSTVFGTANQKLFDFKVTTRFGYNGTDVQYLLPSSTGTIYSGDWTYQGVDSSYSGQVLFTIPNVGIAGDVDKKGLFKRAIFQTTSYTIIHQRCLGDGTYVGNVIY
ncbi:hypothetical protein FRZ06_00075 [Anoxybacterium hadale]|uniref:Uncharacterized protein n=1 Tax=Anoxybacterium hadale TaxID=3408580 RepID=A0ACD1A608_9FIRM|nr:hypothetical protein FRZ06_00075 [Clostridiales bacterium]